MNKKMKKIISILLTIGLMASMMGVVFADEIPIIPPRDDDPFLLIASRVLGYVQYFGYALAIGMLLYLGMKYVMSSANEKADLKKGSINYVIGAIVIAGASAIFGMLANISAEVVGPQQPGLVFEEEQTAINIIQISNFII